MHSFLRTLCFAVASGAALLGSFSRAAESPKRLVNLSTRTVVGTGAAAPVVGFVIGDGSRKQVLVRAIGPGLNQFKLSGTLPNPQLIVHRIANNTATEVGRNDDWTANSVGGAETFSAVGAFANIHTRDAALLVDLGPGVYTAQVTGIGKTATGLVLLEVYDVTGAARLMNLSTRAMVGTGSGVIISGLSIPAAAGTRKILVRAAGPTLAAAPFNLPDALLDPALAIVDGNGQQIAANDNWHTENAAALSAAAAQTGAFPLLTNSKDSALIIDLAPGRTYTMHVSGVGGTTGLALIEVYDLTPENLPIVSVSATTATTDNKGAAPGVFTFTRTGDTASPLTVYYDLSGTATAGYDYDNLPGVLTIPAGASSADVILSPRAENVGAAINRHATITIASAAGYATDTARSASVTIFYNSGALYLTTLRPPAGAISTAFGTATIQLADDHTFAIVDLRFSNLSSPETVAYLRLGNPGEVGTELLRLPNGQVTGQVWQLRDTAEFTAAEIAQAIKDGRVFVNVESAANPTGELRGAFVQSSGSLAFSPPPAPSPLSDAPLAAAEVARFLTQATFGPTKAEIDALTGKRLADLNAWIDTQLSLPASLHLDATRADYQAFDAAREGSRISQSNRQAAWWKLSLTAPDQLRQRVAFALSEILVVSDANPTLFSNARGEGLSNYYDILVRGAFGNFRQVLEEVTLSPVMGFYLSSLRNPKSTTNASGQTTSPDENFAREVMQLFTIGLHQLQPDGTLKLDAQGVPIPTYDQKVITEMAKVFTGWGYYSANANPSFRGATADWLRPMMLYPGFHDDTAKAIVGGYTLPPSQGGVKDLRDTLDALFNHPNTGPFISRQLIQRLVTSNPSPGYIYRVAQVFANNGSGTRGDLGAVVRAILMDYEARSAEVAQTASFGKLKEPLLRITGLLRAFDGGANTGRYAIFNPEAGIVVSIGQAALRAPTVFNFFEPNYVQPGSLAAAGLYAPEFQILTDTTAISLPNQFWNYLFATRSSSDMTETRIGFLFDAELVALARTPEALVERTNLLLASGSLPKAITDSIVNALTKMPANDVDKVRSAIYLTLTVPQGAIQK